MSRVEAHRTADAYPALHPEAPRPRRRNRPGSRAAADGTAWGLVRQCPHSQAAAPGTLRQRKDAPARHPSGEGREVLGTPRASRRRSCKGETDSAVLKRTFRVPPSLPKPSASARPSSTGDLPEPFSLAKNVTSVRGERDDLRGDRALCGDPGLPQQVPAAPRPASGGRQRRVRGRRSLTQQWLRAGSGTEPQRRHQCPASAASSL